MHKFLVLTFLFSFSAYGINCKDLNDLYFSKYEKDLNANLISKKGFDCPSNSSSIVEAIYSLDSLILKRNDDNRVVDYYQYIVDAYDSFGYDSEYNSAPNSESATAYNRGDKVYIADVFFYTDYVYQSYVLVHEARHSHFWDTAHVKCRRGSMKGRISCDEAFYFSTEKGSGYNAGAKYLYDIVYQSEYTTLGKGLALTTLKSLVGNRFNRIDDSGHKAFFQVIRNKKVHDDNAYKHTGLNLDNFKYYLFLKEAPGAYRIEHSGISLYDGALYIGLHIRNQNKRRIISYSIPVVKLPKSLILRIQKGKKLIHLDNLFILKKIVGAQSDTFTVREYFYKRHKK